MSIDVAGYTRLMARDEAGTLAALKATRKQITDPEIERNAGRLVKLMGDGALIEFNSVVQATECAVAIQRQVAARNRSIPSEVRIEFRIGINLGDVILEGDDIYGDGVNVAARLEALADPGGICVSEAVRTAVGSKLPLGYAFLGERTVKNIDAPIRAYKVLIDVEAADTSALLCPYPGMVPFSGADSEHFYGRSEEVERMVQLLRRQRFLMVIGPSGSGKSSLVYAGLLPALKSSRFFAEKYWLVRTMRPGPDPMRALASVLATSASEDLEPGSVDALLEAENAQRLLLLVDQFEEVFTQADRAERSQFIAALQALRAPDNAALILTLRADFYPDLMNSYLWPIDPSQRIEVAPLRGEALRQAVLQPAADVGVQIEERLVAQLLHDASDEPGALPLLQETMALLWDEIEDRSLSFHAYQRLSDLAGQTDNDLSGLAVAIAMRADMAMADLSQDQQRIARRIFLRLIQFGEGRADTRRQQSIEALRASSDPPGAFEQTLEHLTSNRLLTRSGGGEDTPSVVDISHEALIAGWSRLQDWADERREAEQMRRRLEGKAAEWVRLGKGSGGLLDEAELPEAERWLASPDAENLGFQATLPELVAESQLTIAEAESERERSRRREVDQAQALASEQARAAKRMRRAAMALAAVFLLAVGGAVMAWQQSRIADASATAEAEARANAERSAAAEAEARAQADARRIEAEGARQSALAQLLTIHSSREMGSDQDTLAALLAVQAHRVSETGDRLLKTQIDGQLRSIASKPFFRNTLSGSADAVAFSPDGKWLAIASYTSIDVVLFDLTKPGAPVTILKGFPGTTSDENSTVPVGRMNVLSFSADSRQLLAGNADGTIGVWQVDRPNEAFSEWPVLPGGIHAGGFSPNGRWLALSSRIKDRVTIWDLQRPDRLPKIIAFPENDAPDGSFALNLQHGASVAFEADGSRMATGGLDGTIRLWDLAELHDPLTTMAAGADPILALAFVDDMLVSAGADGRVLLWSSNDPDAAPIVLPGGRFISGSIAVNPEVGTVYAGNTEEGIRVWTLGRLEDPPETFATGARHLALSPDSLRLATVGASFGTVLHDVGPSGRPRVLTEAKERIFTLAVSPDSRLLASAESGLEAIKLWHLDDPDAVPRIIGGHNAGTVTSVHFSVDGKQLLSASWNDSSVRLWPLDSPGMRQLDLPTIKDQEPLEAIFAPDGQSIFTSGLGGVYRVNPASTGGSPEKVVTDEYWVSQIELGPSGQLLASASYTNLVNLTDLSQEDAPTHRLEGHENYVRSVVFSRDGSTLYSAGVDAKILAWQTANPENPATVFGEHSSDIKNLAVSPDGRQLASAAEDGIRLWSIEDPDVVPITLSAHDGVVYAVAYTPDGRSLISAGVDATIRIWDLSHPVNSAATDRIAEIACVKAWRNLTLDEWQRFVGPEITYERTCSNLPLHESIFDRAESLAKSGDLDAAKALLARAKDLDSKLQFDPAEEVKRLAASD